MGFTSNLISSGVRESLRYLVQHRMVNVVVTTAGGIEEDLIKARFDARERSAEPWRRLVWLLLTRRRAVRSAWRRRTWATSSWRARACARAG